MTKYLYGAAVQGIQNFIFQTNELKDIVGASELVENICTIHFAKMLYGPGQDYVQRLKDDPCAVINAAGNIKYIFDDENKCKEIVLKFPRQVVEYAPGITISQAVVKYEEGKNFSDVVDDLEQRLRAQRNKPMKSTTIGLMGIMRSWQTGLPVAEIYKEDELDEATFKKRYHQDWNGSFYRKRTTKNLCIKSFGKSDLKADPDNIKNSEIAYDIKQITDKNDWIAVIHADGNGLGQVVQKIGKDEKGFREFSQKLDAATVLSAQQAFVDIQKDYTWKKVIPIRPVVLGGDDLTVICRGDLALDYVSSFIDHFEKYTAEKLGDVLMGHKVFEKGEVRDHLTACAGIAYVKSSYPFYYGYELAEALCAAAKSDAKDSDDIRQGKALPASCLMFHKVQDSFVEDYASIEDRELRPNDETSFKFGPYYTKDTGKDRWTVEILKNKVKELKGKEGNVVKSHLRNWMSLLHDNKGMASQKLFRLKEIVTEEMEEYVNEVTKGREEDGIKIYPTYDMLAIHTINNQETNSKEE